MRPYEVMVIYDADLDEADIKAAVGQATRQFERSGADNHGPTPGFVHDADDQHPPPGGIDLAPAGTYAQLASRLVGSL